MKKRNYIQTLFVLFLIIQSSNVFSAIIPFHTRIFTPHGGTVVQVGQPEASDMISISAGSSLSVDRFVKGIITFGVDHHYPTILPSMRVKIEVLVHRWSNESLISADLSDTTVFLEVSSSANDSLTFLDKQHVQLNGVEKYSVEIVDIWVNGSTTTDLPVNLYLDADIYVDRYYDFVNQADDVISPTWDTLDLNCDNQMDILNISWSPVVGAEEYQLEWAYINDYGTTSTTFISASNLPVNYKLNSTRISTSFSSYDISLTFDRGYICYRVRAIGRDITDLNKQIFGVWSSADAGMVSDMYRFHQDWSFEGNKNWQYSTSYAEEGKKKEVVSFFDGSLRNRQMVTKVNSDENTIVGETIYDHQGRPAIQVLPVPVSGVDCSGSSADNVLQFYPNFNQNSEGDAYSRLDFDISTVDSCDVSSGSMKTTSGASNYYSVVNGNQTEHNAFIPNANGRPFTQIEYTPDNTGRIRRQSGIGEDFKLGSTHETKYYYSHPTQIQLDRMFGSEVGDASHYQKNMVVDPNGQVSVSYLDQEGRVIATSLAGEVPTNLKAMETAASGVVLTDDLFATDALGNTNLNVLNAQGTSKIFSEVMSLSSTTNVTFTYNLLVDTLFDACLAEDICFSCIYDLTIQVFDECGVELTAGESLPTHAGHFEVNDTTQALVFTTTCSEESSEFTFDPALSFTLELGVGTYTVVKTLTVNEAAKDFYVEAYLDSNKNTCIKTLHDFEQEFLSEVDYSDCDWEESCETCLASLGTLEDFIANGLGTAQEYKLQREACLEPCYQPSMCDTYRDLMLGDVSPGGQYAEYTENEQDSDVNAIIFPLSVLNENNQLAFSGSWKEPKIWINGILHEKYYAEDSLTEIRIVLNSVVFESDGVTIQETSPDVDNYGQVYFDNVTNTYYTVAQNLTYLADFLGAWENSFAASLLVYHPEYHFYETCLEYKTPIQEEDEYTSESFDQLITRIETWDDAVTAGLIKSSYLSESNYSERITDWFTSGAHAWDPFVAYAGTHFEGLGDELRNRYFDYKIIDGIHYSMPEIAAMITRCGTGLLAPPVNPTCIEFGNDVGIDPIVNKNKRDEEWQKLKGFYISEKQALQQELAVERSINDPNYYGYNGCIGNESFNPYQDGFFDPYLMGFPPVLENTQYFNPDQPCKNSTYAYYKYKQKRFATPADLLSMDPNEMAFQNYMMTGQCPITANVQSLFNEIAQDGNLTSSSFSFNDYSSFSGTILAQTSYNFANLPNPVPAMEWQQVSMTSSYLEGNIVALPSSTVVGTITFDLPAIMSPAYSFSDIKSFYGMQFVSESGGIYTFEIKASIEVGGITYQDTLTGTTDVNIQDCQFQEVCTRNDLGIELPVLLGVLASQNKLTSPLQVQVLGGGSQYEPFLTTTIQHAINPEPIVDAFWKYDASSHAFQLFESSSLERLDITINSIEPSSFSFANLNLIKGFAELIPTQSNTFDLIALDGFGNYLATLKCDAIYWDNSSSTRVAVGNCSQPTPATCSGESFENTESLGALLVDVLNNQSFDVGDGYDFSSSPFFTQNLSSYFGSELNSTISDSSSELVGGIYVERVEIYNDVSCKIKLEHHDNNSPALNWEYLVSVSDFTPYGERDEWGDFHDFYLLASYDTGSGVYNDTIFGTSCIPLNVCRLCANDVPGGILPGSVSSNGQDYPPTTGLPSYLNCEDLYDRYLDAYNTFQQFQDSSLGCEDYFTEIPLLSFQDFLDSNICCSQTNIQNVLNGFVDQFYNNLACPESPLPAFESCSTAYEPQNYPCRDSYRQYLELLDAYNFSDWANANEVYLSHDQFINVEDFYSSGKCFCIGYYVDYLTTYINADSMDVLPSPQALKNFGFCQYSVPEVSDTCAWFYVQYLNQYSDYQQNQFRDSTCENYQTLYPPYSYQDFIDHNICCSLNNMFASAPFILQFSADTTTCPSISLPTFESCGPPKTANEPCADLMLEYLLAIEAYNNSAWAKYHTTSLNFNVDNFYGRCACAQGYLDYIQMYIDADSTAEMDKPYRFNESYKCPTPTNPESCEDAYDAYYSCYNTFKDWTGVSGYSLPSLISFEDFVEDNLCRCVDDYCAYLNDVQKGFISEVDYGSGETIYDRCMENTMQPCQPENPVSWGGPTVMDTTQIFHDPCTEILTNAALANAWSAYQSYIDSIENYIASKYYEHCLGAIETFTRSYTDNEYHRTLYYYDQAGNLIKTVPPEGVELLATTSSFDAISLGIANDRQNGTHNILTSHRLTTTYVYNSLNQLMRQNTPDQDELDIWEITLPNGLQQGLSVTAIQMINSSLGYLTGNLTTVGGQERAFLYRTDNGGVNWRKVNHTVGANLVKVKMASTNVGYAIGEAGVILKTINTGASWDMLDTYTSIGYISDLNDLLVESETVVSFVGKSDVLFSTTDGGVTFSSSTIGLPAGVSGTIVNIQTINKVTDGTVLEITIDDGTEFYDAILHVDNDVIEPVITQNYSGIYAVNATHAFAFDNGVLVELETPASGTSFKQRTVPLDRYHHFDQAYFLNSDRGMINDDGKLYFTVDGGHTWSLFDDQTSFNSLEVLSKTGTQLELLVIGENALSKRILFSLNSDPQYIDHSNYLNPQSLTLVKSASFQEVSGKRFVVADQDGKLYVSSLIQTGVEMISYSLIGQLNPSDPGELIENIVLKSITGGVVSGVVRSNYGNVYNLHRSSSSSLFSISYIDLGVLATPNVNTIYLNETDNHVYAYSDFDRNIYRIILSAGGPVSTGTSLANPLSGSFYVESMTQNAGRVTLAGDGHLYTTNDISGTNTLTTWNERSDLRIKQKINTSITVPFLATDALEIIGNNTFAAVRLGSGSGVSWRTASIDYPVNVDIKGAALDGTIAFMAGSNGGVLGYGLLTGPFPVILTDGTTVDHNSFPNTDFTGVAMEGNMVFICGTNGTMLYTEDFTTTPFSVTSAGAYPGVDFTSVSIIPGFPAAYAVGNDSKIYRFAGVTGTEVKNVFNNKLKDVHFKDQTNGSILGNDFFVRQTNDGGETWDVVLPQNDISTQLNSTSRRIWTVDANYALLVGVDHLSEIKNGLSTKQTVSGTPQFTSIQFGLNNPLHGFVARGGSIQKIDLTPSGGTYSVALGSTYTPSSAPSAITAMHVFENGNLMAVGTDRFVSHMSNAGVFTPYTTGIPSGTDIFYDVFFHDDVVGYVVGQNGLMYRSENVSINAVTHAIESLEWKAKPTTDSEVSDSTLVDIRAIDFSSRHLGVWGGVPASSGNRAYVRRIKDESNDFDSRFFYDRLGRLVVSQNARQFNTHKFSYSLYDALGRVYEAGEKEENDLDDHFASIFGTDVGGVNVPTIIDDEKLAIWIDGDGARREVTRSYYDQTVLTGLPVDFTPNSQTQRKRITHVTYEAVYDGDDQTFDHATHYDYDIHGNVKTLLQDNQKMAQDVMLANHRFKRMDYNFDLISGNVHRVSYELGDADQWHHAYDYDADNRITDVYTTKTTPMSNPNLGLIAAQNEPEMSPYWDKEASYSYYAHGPLKRSELGEEQVQALDYIYTLQGWLKGVNSNTLDATRDPGAATNTLQPNRARDVFGYSLHYFEGDYTPIGGSSSFVADQTGSDLTANSYNLYNGNIGRMVTTITNPTTRDILPLGNAYKYDQLNRLSESRSFTGLNLSANTWNTASTYDGMYFNAFSYDANGNILKQLRKDENGADIDSLSYKYRRNTTGKLIQNRLYHVKDQVSAGTFGDDIDDMGTFFPNPDDINEDNNYVYDEEGRLIEDKKDTLEITWRVDGKVLKIARSLSPIKKNLIFEYDAMGNRVAKHVLNSSDVLEKSTYYILDAQGNTMSVYERVVDNEEESVSFYQAEKHIYGSSRLGMYNDSISLLGSENATYSMALVEHQIGKRIYELSNHLGNVLTTISDKPMPYDDDADDETDWFLADIRTAQDYSPFGVTLSGRSFSVSEGYRYGFNGMEKDNEVKGQGNSYTTEFRQYDPRLGRWLSLDPLMMKFPWESPYAAFHNNPIVMNDVNGDAPTPKQVERRIGRLKARLENEYGKNTNAFNARFSYLSSAKRYGGNGRLKIKTQGENDNNENNNRENLIVKKNKNKGNSSATGWEHKKTQNETFEGVFIDFKDERTMQSVNPLPASPIGETDPDYSQRVSIPMKLNTPESSLYFSGEILEGVELVLEVNYANGSTENKIISSPGSEVKANRQDSYHATKTIDNKVKLQNTKTNPISSINVIMRFNESGKKVHDKGYTFLYRSSWSKLYIGK